MNDRLVQVRVVALAILALVAFYTWTYEASVSANAQEDFTVTFLGVGQGDAILIQTPDGIDVLIDGGRGDKVLRELADVLGAFDRTIDLVIATHPDADHIGGLIPVLERYEVQMLMRTDNVSDTDVADRFVSYAEEEGAELVYARAGQKFELGASTTIAILFPFDEVRDMESNASSIILKVSYGDADFLLTGDSPKEIEMLLVERYGEYLESEVLKLGHHGSKTSTDERFLTMVSPEYGVVSAGEDNTYGHPHEEVLARVADAGVEITSTITGRVTFSSDGIDIIQR